MDRASIDHVWEKEFAEVFREVYIFDPEENNYEYGYQQADMIQEMIRAREMLEEVSRFRGARDYRDYVNLGWWSALHDEILRRDMETCQMCGAPATTVHHCEYPEILGNEDPDDLISLCKSCHRSKHGG